MSPRILHTITITITISTGGDPMLTQLLRVQNFNVSRDGFGAGEQQSLKRPFGHADPGDLFAWAGATASWPNRTDPAEAAVSTTTSRETSTATLAPRSWGATSSAHSGPWDDYDWRGWWGDEPPFHTPVFVLTHHQRPSLTLSGTTFHFVDADPAAALEQAREAAQGQDVRLGGGATNISQFLDADLVDTLPVAVSPMELGSGSQLWESPDELLDRFHREVVPSASGVTHHLFWRK